MTASDGVGWAVLDIGGSVGALVVATTRVWAGREIEIADAGGRRTHAVARSRRHAAYALFPALPGGEYTLVSPPEPLLRFTVRGGEVTHVLASQPR